MARVIRIDRSGAELRPARPTPQGYLRVDGMATRAGVLEYPQPDGTVRRELRPEEEVFSARHLESFHGAPVTDGHPPVMVAPANHRQYAAGTVLGSGERADGDHVKVVMDIADPDLQGKVKRGKRELSPGYTVDLDETPGTHPKYGRYDAVQRNIEVNHLAVVERARAGRGARVRVDAEDVPMGEVPGMQCECGADMVPGEPCPACGKMARADAGGHATCTSPAARYATGMDPKEALAAATAEVAREKARADALEAQLAAEKTRADEAAGQVIALNARLADVEQTRVDADELQALKDKCAALEADVEKERKARSDAESPATRQAAVARRVDIEMAGREFLGQGVRFDTMDDRGLMEAVCHKLRGVKFDAKDPEATVHATFRLLVEDARKNAESNRRIREIVNANRSERADTVESAREKRERETTEAGRKPLPSTLMRDK